MITALVLGAGFSIGLRTLAVWLFPPRPALGAVLARSTTPPAPPPILATEDTGWAARLGRPFIAPLCALGLPGQGLARDLRDGPKVAQARRRVHAHRGLGIAEHDVDQHRYDLGEGGGVKSP